MRGIFKRGSKKDEPNTSASTQVAGRRASTATQVAGGNNSVDYREPSQVQVLQPSTSKKMDQYHVVYDAIAAGRLGKQLGSLQTREFDDVAAYDKARKDAINREGALGFEYSCKSTALDNEIKANKILQAVKQFDNKYVYGAAEPRRSDDGQVHKRFLGDHFLSNADLIEKTLLFQIARQMPKGAHLHIHFNANLLPQVLLDIAKDQQHMYIWSNMPLLRDNRHALARCKLQFSIIQYNPKRKTQNIFEEPYDTDSAPGRQIWMPYKKFREEFAKKYSDKDIDKWLQEKLVFSEKEAHDLLQTSEGAWDLFNGRTQMMKGLFNYETAYRRYTYACLQDFADDQIQYAEIRPNFMATNQVWKDDGSKKMDNWAIMDLIIEVYKQFQRDHNKKVFKGLKIIYCTPRSFSREKTRLSLEECLAFKLVWPDMIAGFDLVGEESKPHPLNFFREEFIDFIKCCKNPAKLFNRPLMEMEDPAMREQGRTLRKKLKERFPGPVPASVPRPTEAEIQERMRTEAKIYKAEKPAKTMEVIINEMTNEMVHVPSKPVDIPFLFHCGETLEVGGDTDGNLYDALLLKAKRIGHGFALARHPYVMEQMKKENICLELCPISNEILGLAPRVNNHAMYELLANNVHCTLNTDNGTLFRSRLSHDFYQAFAGKKDMTIHGWRQLIEWSIEHSCLDDKGEKQTVMKEWKEMWNNFCEWIITTYGPAMEHEAERERAMAQAQAQAQRSG